MTNEKLVELIRLGNHALMGELYEQNRLFILQIARRICGNDTEDAMQDAYFGLDAAVRRYDPNVGALFMTYAAHHIRTAINRGRCAVKRVPEWVQLKAYRINKAQEALTHTLDRAPSNTELAAYIGCTAEDIASTLTAVEPPQSLDLPLAEDLTLADILCDSSVDVERKALETVQAGTVRLILRELPPDEQHAAELNFIRGFNCNKTAAVLHMTEKDTRRLINSAARHLRKPHIYNMLTAADSV